MNKHPQVWTEPSPPPEGVQWPRGVPLPTGEDAGRTLHELLDEELRLSPEYGEGGRLSSHLPMALHALAAMGAPEARLRQWAAAQFPRMPRLPQLVDLPDLQQAEQRIAAQLEREGLGPTLAARLPALMPGCGGMAFHLLIRTAHAWETGHRGQIVRALAHWSLRSAPLPGPMEADGERLGLADWIAAVLALPRGEGGLISDRMQQAAAHPAFQQLAPRLRLEPGLLAGIARWTAAAYADSGNFTLLHALTATRACTVLLPLLPAAARPDALRLFTRQLAAALLASGWRGEGDSLDALDVPPAWPELLAKAQAHDDEHAVKAVHAAWQLGRAENEPLWRRAAARALQRN